MGTLIEAGKAVKILTATDSDTGTVKNELFAIFMLEAERKNKVETEVSYTWKMALGWNQQTNNYVKVGSSINMSMYINSSTKHSLTFEATGTKPWQEDGSMKILNGTTYYLASGCWGTINSSISDWTSENKAVHCTFNFEYEGEHTAEPSGYSVFWIPCPDYWTPFKVTINNSPLYSYDGEYCDVDITASANFFTLKNIYVDGSLYYTPSYSTTYVKNLILKLKAGTHKIVAYSDQSGGDGSNSCSIKDYVTNFPNIKISAADTKIYNGETTTLTATITETGNESSWITADGWYRDGYRTGVTSTTYKSGVGKYTYKYTSQNSTQTSTSTPEYVEVTSKADSINFNGYEVEPVNSEIIKEYTEEYFPVYESKYVNASASCSALSGKEVTYTWYLCYGTTRGGTFVKKQIATSSSIRNVDVKSLIGGGYYYYLSCVADCITGATNTKNSDYFYVPSDPDTDPSFKSGVKIVDNKNQLYASFKLGWNGTSDSAYYSGVIQYWIGSDTSGLPVEVELTSDELKAGEKEFYNGMIAGGREFYLAAKEQINFKLKFTSPDDSIIQSSEFLIGYRSEGAGVNEDGVTIQYGDADGTIKPFTELSKEDYSAYNLSVTFFRGNITQTQSIRYMINVSNTNDSGILQTLTKYYLGVYDVTATDRSYYTVYETDSSWNKLESSTSIITYNNTECNIYIDGENVAKELLALRNTSTNTWGSHWAQDWEEGIPNGAYEVKTLFIACVNNDEEAEDTNEKRYNLILDFREEPFWTNKNFIVGIDYGISNSTFDINSCNFDFSYEEPDYKMVNYKEKICFLIPTYKDYNDDTEYFVIDNYELDSTDGILNPEDYKDNYKEFQKISIGLPTMEYDGKTYHRFEYIFPQYEYNKFMMYRVRCLDSLGNYSEPIYFNNYLIGCRIQKPEWSFISYKGVYGNAEKTREVFEKLTLLYNISDNGGSLFKVTTDKFNYKEFPNLLREWFENDYDAGNPNWKIDYEIYYTVEEGTTYNVIKNSSYITTGSNTGSIDIVMKIYNPDKSEEEMSTMFDGLVTDKMLYSKNTDGTYTLITEGTYDSSKDYYLAKEKFAIKAKLDYAYGLADGILTSPLSKLYVSDSSLSVLYDYCPTFTYFAELPTIAYRQNRIGINTDELDDQTLLEIHETGTNNIIKLVNTDGVEITLDLNNGQIEGVSIDCGTWSHE